MTSSGPQTRPIGWIVLICRFVLAALFLFAAVMKVQNVPAFALAIQAFDIFPEHANHVTKFLAFAIPWAELVAGTFLLLGIWTRAAALTITLMLGAFILGILGIIFRGIDASCSCFGKIDVVCTGPVGWCHVIRNIVLIAMGSVVVWAGPGPLTFDRR